MNKVSAALVALGLLLVSGCDTVPRSRSAGISNTDQSQAASLLGGTPAEKEPNPVSLFPADQAVPPDAAVASILGSTVQVYEQPKLAIIKFPDRAVYHGDDSGSGGNANS